MIPALVRGKLSREQENLEDLLTSNVFGVIRYLPYEVGLRRLLQHADDPGFVGSLPEPSEQLSVTYKFWPWLPFDDRVGCEPDVLVTVASGGVVQVQLLIEAKHLSPKSSYADRNSSRLTDQLALEWACLVRRCEREGGRPMMLYVTGHHGRPSNDIDEARQELEAKRSDITSRYPLNCAWLSWRHLSRAFSISDGIIEGDLLALAWRMDFRFFNGIHPISPPVNIAWRFDDRLVFNFGDYGVAWRAGIGREHDGLSDMLWRFKC